MSKRARRNYVKATSQLKEHKVMHKVRKHWEVIGLSTLMIMAGGVAADHTEVHAASTGAATSIQSVASNSDSSKASSSTMIMKKAKALTGHLMANGVAHVQSLSDNHVSTKSSASAKSSSASNQISSSAMGVQPIANSMKSNSSANKSVQSSASDDTQTLVVNTSAEKSLGSMTAKHPKTMLMDDQYQTECTLNYYDISENHKLVDSVTLYGNDIRKVSDQNPAGLNTSRYYLTNDSRNVINALDNGTLNYDGVINLNVADLTQGTDTIKWVTPDGHVVGQYSVVGPDGNSDNELISDLKSFNPSDYYKFYIGTDAPSIKNIVSGLDWDSYALKPMFNGDKTNDIHQLITQVSNANPKYNNQTFTFTVQPITLGIDTVNYTCNGQNIANDTNYYTGLKGHLDVDATGAATEVLKGYRHSKDFNTSNFYNYVNSNFKYNGAQYNIPLVHTQQGRNTIDFVYNNNVIASDMFTGNYNTSDSDIINHIKKMVDFPYSYQNGGSNVIHTSDYGTYASGSDDTYKDVGMFQGLSFGNTGVKYQITPQGYLSLEKYLYGNNNFHYDDNTTIDIPVEPLKEGQVRLNYIYKNNPLYSQYMKAPLGFPVSDQISGHTPLVKISNPNSVANKTAIADVSDIPALNDLKVDPLWTVPSSDLDQYGHIDAKNPAMTINIPVIDKQTTNQFNYVDQTGHPVYIANLIGANHTLINSDTASGLVPKGIPDEDDINTLPDVLKEYQYAPGFTGWPAQTIYFDGKSRNIPLVNRPNAPQLIKYKPNYVYENNGSLAKSLPGYIYSDTVKYIQGNGNALDNGKTRDRNIIDTIEAMGSVPDGYYLDTSKLINKINNNNIDFNIKKGVPPTQVVPVAIGPNNAQTPGTPIDPNRPNGPKWPDVTKLSNLKKDITRTIKFISTFNATLSPSVVQHVIYTRTAVIDKNTGDLLGYSTLGNTAVDVTPSNGNQAWITSNAIYPSVKTPDLTSLGYENPKYASDVVYHNSSLPSYITNGAPVIMLPSGAKASDVNSDSDIVLGESSDECPILSDRTTSSDSDSTITVQYSANPRGVKVDDKTTHFPGEQLTHNDFYRVRHRFINYVNDQGQTVAPTVEQSVAFKRTAEVDPNSGMIDYFIIGRNNELTPDSESDNETWGWMPVNSSLDSIAGSYNDIEGKFLSQPSPKVNGYGTPDLAIVNSDIVDCNDGDEHVTVTYPMLVAVNSDSSSDTLKQYHLTRKDVSRTITRTINLENKAGQPIPYYHFDPQQVRFARTIIINKDTGQIMGYSSDGSNNIKFSPAQSDQAWTAQTPDDWQGVTAPSPKHPVPYDNPTPAIVSDVQPTPNTSDKVVNIVYSDQISDVNPNDSRLRWAATRTIKYEGPDGQTVAPTKTQTVNYQRTAKLDKATGQLVNVGNWTVSPGSASNWSAVSSPNNVNDQVPNLTTVGGVNVDPGVTNNTTVVVTYSPDLIRSTESKSVKQIIRYVDHNNNEISPSNVQTVQFNRTVLRDKQTGQIAGYSKDGKDKVEYTPAQSDQAWTPVNGDNSFSNVSSPDLTSQGYDQPKIGDVKSNYVTPETNSPRIINVIYDDATIVATPNNPGNPGQNIDLSKKNWPNGTDRNSLSKTIIRTINYQNGNTPQKVIAKPVTQKVIYTRQATVDKVTGRVISYSPWTTSHNQWSDVKSPDLTSQGYDNPNVSDVSNVTVGPSDQNSDVLVTYNDIIDTVKPGDHKTWPSGVSDNNLTKTITRTIEYRNNRNPSNRVYNSDVQNITYNRDAYVDKATDQVKYGKWTTSNNVWPSVISPDLTKEGYGQPSIQNVSDETVSPSDSSINVTVQYNDATIIATPSDNVTSGQLIVPDGGRWPSQASPSNLVKTITRDIYYKNDRSQSIAPSVQQTVTYTRTAKVDKVTGNWIRYSNWTSSNDQWPSKPSPDLSNDGYGQPDQQVVSSDYVKSDDNNTSDTVIYPDATIVITSNNSQIPGTPINLNDPNGAKWPADAGNSNLSKTSIRTINYVDSDNQQIADPVKQSVTYTRSVKIDKATGSVVGKPSSWSAEDSETNWPEVPSPDLTKDGYITPTPFKVSDQPVSAGEHNSEVTVHYGYAETTATPDDAGVPGNKIDPNNSHSATWPDGADHNSLVKVIPRTIQYENTRGQRIAPSDTQEVTYTRTRTVADNTGNWVDNYTPWKLASKNAQWSAVQSPDLSTKGYIKPSQQPVPKVGITSDTKPDNEIVTYQDATVTVDPDDAQTPGQRIDPNDPNSANWPDGVSYNDLNHNTVRTINYENDNGDQIADPVTQTVKYTRNVTVDKVTGQIVPNSYSKWQSDGSWAEVKSPDLTKYDYIDPTCNSISEAKPQTDAQNPYGQDVNVIVKYSDATSTATPDDAHKAGTLIDPNNPHSAKWPNGVDHDSLVKVIPRTIHYKNTRGQKIHSDVTQAVVYTRTKAVDNITGNSVNKDNNGYTPWKLASNTDQWHSVPSPDLSGEGYIEPDKSSIGLNSNVTSATKPDDETVTYQDATVTIDPDDAQTPGQRIDPNDPNSSNWPDGVSYNDLNHNVIRTINYENDNGDQIATPVTQTVKYTRNVTVDKVTGQIVNNGYSNWRSDGTWSAVKSPDMSSDGYGTPDKVQVNSQPTTEKSSNSDVTVKYPDTYITITPSNPQTPGTSINPNDSTSATWPNDTDINNLNRKIVRTINYVDQRGNQVAPSVTKIVKYHRNVTVDKVTGKASYNSDDQWQTNNYYWPDVESPDLSLKGYAKPVYINTNNNGSDVPKTLVKPDDSSKTITVEYKDGTVTVSTPKSSDQVINDQYPDSPNYPDGLGKSDLFRTITRVIYYQNNRGQNIHEPVSQPINYHRSATVDKVTGKLLHYNNWLNKDNQLSESWPSVVSPDLSSEGYGVQKPPYSENISPQNNVPAESTYGGNEITYSDLTKPEKALLGATYNRDSKGITKDTIVPVTVKYPDLKFKRNEAVHSTRTIYYVDETTGDLIKQPTIQKVAYQNTATVDVPLGPSATKWSGWKPLTRNTDWAGLSSHDLDLSDRGYAKPDLHPLMVPNKPVNPGDPDINIVIKYPQGTWNNQPMNNTITRTIYYEDAQTHQFVAKPVVQHVSYNTKVSTNAVTHKTTFTGWKTANNKWAAVTSPTPTQLSDTGHSGYEKPDKAMVNSAAVNPTDQDQQVFVYYNEGTADVPEADTITRTIYYEDAQTHQFVAKPVTQTVTYNGKAHANAVTKRGTTTWTTANNQWPSQVSPDLSDQGYDSPDKASVASDKVPVDGSDVTVIVNYKEATATQPETEKITRTIYYRDAQTHQQIAKPVTQAIIYNGKVTANAVTGKANASWSSKDNKWPSVVSPTTSQLSDAGHKYYENPDKASINAYTVSPDDLDQTVNVYYPEGHITMPELDRITRTIYYEDAQTGDEIAKPVIQTVTYKGKASANSVTGKGTSTFHTSNDVWSSEASPDLSDKGYQTPDITNVSSQVVKPGDSDSVIVVRYQQGVWNNQSELNTVTRTIYYEDAQTHQFVAKPVVQHVTYNTKVSVNAVTGKATSTGWHTSNNKWSTIKSPTPDQLSDAGHHGYEKPDKALITSATADPNSHDQNVFVYYNEGTADVPEADTITRTIYYEDAQTGNEIAKPVTQTITYNGEAYANAVTGKGTSIFHAANNRWPSQVSPDLSDKGYNTPNIKTVASQVVKPGDFDSVIVVKYPQGTSTLPESNTITRTIYYEDAQTHQFVAKPIVQKVTYNTMVTADAVTGKSTFTGWYTSNNKWANVESPTPNQLSKNGHFGYNDPDKAIVKTTAVKPNGKDQNVYVYYAERISKVPETDSITRTIYYEDANTGQQIAKPIVQTVTYNGDKFINAVTGKGTLTWRVSNNMWPSQKSPDLSEKGYAQPDITKVSKQTIDLNHPNSVVIIKYQPSMSQGPETRIITRTIKYRNGNHIVAPSDIQTVNYHRTVTTNKVTGKKTYGPWSVIGNNNLPAVNVPDLSSKNYKVIGNPVIPDINVTPDSKDESVIVHYEPITPSSIPSDAWANIINALVIPTNSTESGNKANTEPGANKVTPNHKISKSTSRKPKRHIRHMKRTYQLKRNHHQNNYKMIKRSGRKNMKRLNNNKQILLKHSQSISSHVNNIHVDKSHAYTLRKSQAFHKTHKSQRLPQTGENQNSSEELSLLFVIVALGILGIDLYRKHINSL